MNHKGFAPIIIILIVLMLGTTIVAGVVFINRVNQDKLTTTTPPSSSPSLVASSSESPKPSPKQKTATGSKTPTPTASPKPTNSPLPVSQTSTPTPAPTQTSYPPATACSSVTVTGATYAGNVGGKDLYYLASGASATFHANTTPTNGSVNWKVASYSSFLPSGGAFSANNNPTTVWTAPTNTSGSDQGVEIRGDISENPNPWIYCPPFTMAVRSS